MEYSDSNELVDVEVVRLQSIYPKEDPQDLVRVQNLCKAFYFGLKIIDLYDQDGFSCRQYEISFDPHSFYAENYRTVIKTFTLCSELQYVSSKVIQMKLYDFIDLPSDGIFEEETHFVCKHP